MKECRNVNTPISSNGNEFLLGLPILLLTKVNDFIRDAIYEYIVHY